MSIPTSEPIHPTDETELPPARKRRQQRSLLPHRDDERAAFLDQLARQVTPAFDFFLFALLAGALIGAAILFDSPGFYILAVLFSPFLGPVYGLSLAVVVGSGRFFIKALGSFLIACLVILVLGVAAGLIARFLIPSGEFQQTYYHALFTWPDFLVLAVGSGLATYMLVRSPRQKPLVANVAVAYELFLPLAVAGFGLSSGMSALWIDGLVVFVVHLAWAALIGALVLFFLGLRPVNLFGYTLATTIGLIGVITLIVITGLTMPRQVQVAQPVTPAATITPTASYSSTPAPTQTQQPSQVIATLTATIRPTSTMTLTVTPRPTPVWARVSAPSGDGAFLRVEPDGAAITVLLNGNMVEVVSEPVRGDGGTIWVQVRTDSGQLGWMVQALLATATPSPGW